MKRQTTENWFKRVLTDGGPLATAFAKEKIDERMGVGS